MPNETQRLFEREWKRGGGGTEEPGRAEIGNGEATAVNRTVVAEWL